MPRDSLSSISIQGADASRISQNSVRLAARGSLKRALKRRNGVQSSGSMADETIVRVSGNVSLTFANVNPMNMGYQYRYQYRQIRRKSASARTPRNCC
jgi:hypothetical protein